jgi:hypothetical protein
LIVCNEGKGSETGLRFGRIGGDDDALAVDGRDSHRMLNGYLSFTRFCTINFSRLPAWTGAPACALVFSAMCKPGRSLPVCQSQTPRKYPLANPETECQGLINRWNKNLIENKRKPLFKGTLL